MTTDLLRMAIEPPKRTRECDCPDWIVQCGHFAGQGVGLVDTATFNALGQPCCANLNTVSGLVMSMGLPLRPCLQGNLHFSTALPLPASRFLSWDEAQEWFDRAMQALVDKS